jgi:hypothetical protein
VRISAAGSGSSRVQARVAGSTRPIALRLAELDCELGQQVARAQVAAGPGDLVAQHTRQREVLEQRDQVGEGLVERERVRIARVEQGRVHAVEDRVRRLVGHDVLGQAREHRAPGIDASRIRVRGREVAEEQRLALRIVERVLLPQRVRVDAQLTDVLGGAVARYARRPQHPAPQGVLEVLDRPHRHRIHHLLVELRARLRRREPVLGEQGAVVEVDGRVEAAARGVVVDHVQVVAARPGLELRLPRHLVDDLVDRGGLELGRELRVERVAAQPPPGGLRELDGARRPLGLSRSGLRRGGCARLASGAGRALGRTCLLEGLFPRSGRRHRTHASVAERASPSGATGQSSAAANALVSNRVNGFCMLGSSKDGGRSMVGLRA